MIGSPAGNMECRDIIAKMEKINFTTGEIIRYLKRFQPMFTAEQGSRVQQSMRTTEGVIKDIRDIVESAETVSSVCNTVNNTEQEQNPASGKENIGALFDEAQSPPTRCKVTVKCEDDLVWEDTVECEDTEMCEESTSCEDIKQEVIQNLNVTDIRSTYDFAGRTDNNEAMPLVGIDIICSQAVFNFSLLQFGS